MKNLTAIFGSLLMSGFDYVTLAPGHKDGDCKLDGTAGRFFQSVLIDGWINQGNRCILKTVPRYGSVQKKDGLKGLMINREVDMTIFPTTIHEITNYSHIRYTEPLLENYLLIGSSYQCSDETSQSSLMAAYLAFPISLYVSIMATLIIFIISWSVCCRLASKIRRKFRRKIRRARLSPSWIMICAILDQDQFPDVSKVSFSILSLCFSTFFYFTIDCYMLNSMSTDLVVPIEPIVVRTLNDVIKRDDVKLLIVEGSDEEVFFANAPPNTTESRIWNNDQKVYKAKDFDAKLVPEIWAPLKNGKITGLLRDTLMLSMANIGLTTTRDSGDESFRAFVTDDEQGRSFTQAMMINDIDSSDPFKRFIHKRLSLLAQSNLIGWFISVRSPQILGRSDINIDRFVSKKLDLAESPLPLVELRHTQEIFFTCSALLIVATIVLMFENCDHFVMKNIL